MGSISCPSALIVQNLQYDFDDNCISDAIFLKKNQVYCFWENLKIMGVIKNYGYFTYNFLSFAVFAKGKKTHQNFGKVDMEWNGWKVRLGGISKLCGDGGGVSTFPPAKPRKLFFPAWINPFPSC